MEISLRRKNGDEIILKTINFKDKPEERDIYFLVPVIGGQPYLKLRMGETAFEVIYSSPDIGETTEALQSKLDELFIELNPENNLGTEDTETEASPEETPYDPDKIRVEPKQFSLRQVYDMIRAGDIDLSPDFQRHLVWDNQRKSRLIESILLRIPLPMFYFAQDEEGRISVVDGLQRLSAIREFMDNEFKLRGLEYLEEKCGNKYYKSESNPSIDAKYFRWFNMTQITVNVIDHTSPTKLKYDIFRRINTGGKPLNSQEIRNCLASPSLRKALKDMASLDSFKLATGGSVKDVRMESQELALRFILFLNKYTNESSLINYNGNIESELNNLTDELTKNKNVDYDYYTRMFDEAMINAYHLFGRYAFRKCKLKDVTPGAYRTLLNKALFVSWSVLLSKYPSEFILETFPQDSFSLKMAQKVEDNYSLFNYLTYSTNSKVNLQAVFRACEEILKENSL